MASFWPNAPLFEQQWNLHMLGFPEVWAIQRGRAEVSVAVIERGVHLTHPDLQRVMLKPIDLWNQWSEPKFADHGTQMCGIIAAQIDNGMGICGLAPECRILPIRCNSYDDQHLVCGIRIAVEESARVINLSDAGYQKDIARGRDAPRGSWTIPSADDLFNACQHAADYGVLIVSATGGNGAQCCLGYPSVYPGVFNVAPCDKQGNASDFADYGPVTQIMAPGGFRDYPPGAWGSSAQPGARAYGVLSCISSDHGYKEISGGCPAIAHISGIAALLFSQHPEWDAGQVRTVLTATAGDQTWSLKRGWGLVDPLSALKVNRVEAELSIKQVRFLPGPPPRVAVSLHNAGVVTVRALPVIVYEGSNGDSVPIQLGYELAAVPGRRTVQVSVTLDKDIPQSTRGLAIVCDLMNQRSASQIQQDIKTLTAQLDVINQHYELIRISIS